MEPIQEEMVGEVLDETYKITMRREEYFTPNVDGVLSWCNISWCVSDYERG